MQWNETYQSIKKKAADMDVSLLVFLLLFLNVKLIIKLIGLVFIFIRQKKSALRFSMKAPGIPYFYPLMIGIALVNLLLFGLYKTPHYPLLFITGVGFWLICILAFYQVSATVQRLRPEIIHATLLVFFVLNIVCSYGNLLRIMLEIGEWNPYRYQGLYQKYFIGTGDYIRGISFDTSTTNALISAFGILYFLTRKQMLLSLLCMSVLLLTCSNFTNLMMVFCLLWIFLFRSDKEQKSIVVVMFAMLVIFMVNITPQNNQYSINIVEKAMGRKGIAKPKIIKEIPVTEKPDSVLTDEEKKIKKAKLYLDSMARLNQQLALQQKNGNKELPLVPVIPKVNIHAPEYQHRQDSSETRMQALAFLRKITEKDSVKIDTATRINQLPGKLKAMQQLLEFEKRNPSRWFSGNGMGNFSSKLAFRATGLKISGGYPASQTYVGKDFEKNHLAIYLNYFGKDSGFHSIANAPNSFYGQLLSEYGLLGIAAFLFFYVAYYLKGYRQLTYGLPVFFVMMGALVTDYWFEQLSVVILFELLLLLNKKETQNEIRIADEKL